MAFKMWSPFHFLYIISPFVLTIVLYYALKNKSEKTKKIVGIVIGSLSLLILVIRNVNIYLTGGFHPEIIPLQVCHFGNIAVFFSLVFNVKAATAMALCFNLLPAFSSLVVADALLGYQSIFQVRAQAYIWGHLFIIIGALYPLIVGMYKFNLKNVLHSMYTVTGLLAISIIANTFFNDFLSLRANYFYIYDSRGVPFDLFYNITKPVTIGAWFTFNPIYVVSLIIMGLALYFLIYWSYLKIGRKIYQSNNLLS